MGKQDGNPIQQRMELFVEKWEALRRHPDVKLVRIQAKDNEKDMVDAFYAYLLGVDTDNSDIPIIFQSIYHDDEQYTEDLLAELTDMIETWNAANKDSIQVAVPQLAWLPDPKLVDEDNPAFLFIKNINNLAAHLTLGEDVFLVPILQASFTKPNAICRWLHLGIKAGIHSKVKLVVDDTISHPFYQALVDKNPNHAVTLVPDLDMDTALQQVAAMGKPDDPAVQYRKAFVLLVQAIGSRKEKEAERHAQTCIEIATKNLERNPYWIGQLIAVNAALANDQVGYKNYKKAIEYSTRGVEAAQQSKEIVTDEFIYRKFMAQAVMLRASLYTVTKNWQHAIDDFTIAANHYAYTNDLMLAMEAKRMIGYATNKYGKRDAACQALAEAVAISRKIPEHTLKATTFAGVIELLIEINNFKYISNEEVQDAAWFVYGDDWIKEVKNWKNPHYEQQDDPAKAMM
jgi:tetratricopeptide (TPR) repeat protein